MRVLRHFVPRNDNAKTILSLQAKRHPLVFLTFAGGSSSFLVLAHHVCRAPPWKVGSAPLPFSLSSLCATDLQNLVSWARFSLVAASKSALILFVPLFLCAFVPLFLCAFVPLFLILWLQLRCAVASVAEVHTIGEIPQNKTPTEVTSMPSLLWEFLFCGRANAPKICPWRFTPF